MSTASVSLKNLYNKFVDQFRKNISLAFWLIFVFILVYEFFVISRALKPIINPVPISEVKKTQGIRFNFSDFEEVVKNIKENKLYKPETGLIESPFIPPK